MRIERLFYYTVIFFVFDYALMRDFQPLESWDAVARRDCQ